MGFLVHGRDSAAFGDGPDSLHEMHQAYMDGWASQLVARGPTLSEDGSTHTGSIHVLDTTDPEVAQRFAVDEPYAQAGWYSDITVSPYESLVPGTMWDRPAPPGEYESSFALVSWLPERRTPDVVDSIRTRLESADGPPWLFAGLLLSDDSAQVLGLAGSLDLPAAATRSRLEEQLAALSVEDLAVHRWQRGGRSQA